MFLFQNLCYYNYEKCWIRRFHGVVVGFRLAGGGGYDREAGPGRQPDPNPIKFGHTFGMLPHPRIEKIGMSPLQLQSDDIKNVHDDKQLIGMVSPPHSSVVYRLHDINTVFLALLLIQVIPIVHATVHHTPGLIRLCIQLLTVFWNSTPITSTRYFYILILFQFHCVLIGVDCSIIIMCFLSLNPDFLNVVIQLHLLYFCSLTVFISWCVIIVCFYSSILLLISAPLSSIRF